MTFEECKKTFLEISDLCDKMEQNCINGDFDSLDFQFDKMTSLYNQLNLPDDMTSDECEKIEKIKNEVKEKNQKILEYLKENKQKIKQELRNVDVNNKIINAYKIPKGERKSSIFDQGL